eukprot:1138369-Amphidinium_carterae.3
MMRRDGLGPVGGGEAYSTPPCTRANASPGSSEGTVAAASGAEDGEAKQCGSASLQEVVDGSTVRTSVCLSLSERMPTITSVGQLSIPLLERFLAAVEPIALSSNAQRSLRAARSRYISKEKLLQLYEFLTGLGPLDPMPEYLHVVSKWLNTGVEYNALRGRPARDLRLPPNWQEDGHYTIGAGELSGRTKVQHRGLGQSHGIGGFLGSASGALHIEHNYSQKHATLVDGDGLHRLPLMSLFPDVARRDMHAWVQGSLLSPSSVSTFSLGSGGSRASIGEIEKGEVEKRFEQQRVDPPEALPAAEAPDVLSEVEEGMPP